MKGPSETEPLSEAEIERDEWKAIALGIRRENAEAIMAIGRIAAERDEARAQLAAAEKVVEAVRVLIKGSLQANWHYPQVNDAVAAYDALTPRDAERSK